MGDSPGAWLLAGQHPGCLPGEEELLGKRDAQKPWRKTLVLQDEVPERGVPGPEASLNGQGFVLAGQGAGR